jgi:hypothetical protein
MDFEGGFLGGRSEPWNSSHPHCGKIPLSLAVPVLDKV